MRTYIQTGVFLCLAWASMAGPVSSLLHKPPALPLEHEEQYDATAWYKLASEWLGLPLSTLQSQPDGLWDTAVQMEDDPLKLWKEITRDGEQEVSHFSRQASLPPFLEVRLKKRLKAISAKFMFAPPDLLITRMEKERSFWRSLEVDSYRLLFGIYHASEASLTLYHIQVKQHQVVAVTEITSPDGKAFNAREYLPQLDDKDFTIEGLFNLARDVLNSEAAQARIAYHPLWGIPTQIEVDHTSLLEGDEVFYRLFAITPEK